MRSRAMRKATAFQHYAPGAQYRGCSRVRSAGGGQGGSCGGPIELDTLLGILRGFPRPVEFELAYLLALTQPVEGTP